jgi:hypothetical protein
VLSASTDRDDGLGVVEVDAFDTDGGAEDVGVERDRQVLLEHAEQADALLGLAVRINDGFFDEFVESPLTE